MKRFAIIASLALMLLGCLGKAMAQGLPDTPDMKGKFTYGGTIGGGMSGNCLSLSVAPQVGYRIFSPWEVGVRGIYDLTVYFDRVHGNEYCHYFGLAPYTNVEVYKGFFLHVEDEAMYGLVKRNDQKVGKWFNSLYAGGGYRHYTYSGHYIYIMALYNFSSLFPNNVDTWYGSPWVLRLGFCL